MPRRLAPILVACLLPALSHGATAQQLAPKPTAPEQQQPATLTGRILYDGQPPAQQVLTIPLRQRALDAGLGFDTEEISGRRRIQAQGVPDESLIVSENHGIANVIVWLRSRNVPSPAHFDPPPPVQLRAEEVRFKPHVLVFWNKSPLELVNESGAAINMNLGPMIGVNRLLKDGERFNLAIVRDAPLPNNASSNIKPWFKAYIFPVCHPYFAITDANGRFEIKNIPPGAWDFVIWHERAGYLATDKYPRGRFNFNLQPGNNDLGDLKAPPAAFGNAPALFMADPSAEKVEAKPILSDLHRAAMAGNLEGVRTAIAMNESIEAREPRFNASALHYAAREGHAEIVKYLIESHARVDSRDTNDQTPLFWAVKGNHIEVVRQLLDALADINAKDGRGNIALHYALARDQKEIARLLLIRRAKEREGEALAEP